MVDELLNIKIKNNIKERIMEFNCFGLTTSEPMT